MLILKSPWERFCQAYVRGETAGNAHASYRAAGYRSNSRSGASALLKRPEVQSRIAALQAELARRDAEATAHAVERLALSRESVLAELANLAFANILDYLRFNHAGEPVADLSRLNRDRAAPIVDITLHTVTEGSGATAERVKRVRIKLADKRAALVDLGRHFGLFVERKHITDPYEELTDEELERRIAELDREFAEQDAQRPTGAEEEAPRAPEPQ